MIICQTENDGKIHLRWREDEKRQEETVQDFEPYFFVSANSDEPAFYQINMNVDGRRVKLEMPYKYEYGDWKNIHGKELKKRLLLPDHLIFTGLENIGLEPMKPMCLFIIVIV